MKSIKGFIQVPVVVLMAVGILAILGTSYYFVGAKNSKQEEINKKTALSTVPLNRAEVSTSGAVQEIKSGEGIIKEQGTQKIIAPTKQESTNTKKADDLVKEVMSDMDKLSQLDQQIEDFGTLLRAIRTTKNNYISYAKSSAQARADLLNDFADTASDIGIKNFALSDANKFTKYIQSAQTDYNTLYEPLETEVKKQYEMTSEIKGIIDQGTTPANLSKVLSMGNEEINRFLGLVIKFNTAAQKFEQQKADSFSQSLKYIDSLVATKSIFLSVSQQLLQIEQQSQQIPAPQKATQCWSTTQYSGGIVNGTAQTSVRCE